MIELSDLPLPRIRDVATLTNHGDRFALHVEAAGRVYDFPDLYRPASPCCEEHSPRDVAVRQLAALGWRVEGDGSWRVLAWTGPDANRSWAYLVPTKDAR